MPDSVLTRYSCREFTPDPVTVEQLQAIIRAGMQLPPPRTNSPGNFWLSDQSRAGKRWPRPAPTPGAAAERLW